MGGKARVFEARPGPGPVRFKAPIHVRTGGASGFSRRIDLGALLSPFVFQTASVNAERDNVGRQVFKLTGYSTMPVKTASPGASWGRARPRPIACHDSGSNPTMRAHLAAGWATNGTRGSAAIGDNQKLSSRTGVGVWGRAQTSGKEL